MKHPLEELTPIEPVSPDFDLSDEVIAEFGSAVNVQPKECYKNCYLIAAVSGGRFQYVEGYAFSLIPFHHALLLETATGKYADPTFAAQPRLRGELQYMQFFPIHAFLTEQIKIGAQLELPLTDFPFGGKRKKKPPYDIENPYHLAAVIRANASAHAAYGGREAFQLIVDVAIRNHKKRDL